MCGICGKLSFVEEPVERSLIKKMADTIVHRGPDDEGIYTAPGIGLGQRRLAIIDLSSGATAPLGNEDGSVWVVFNGEIYNFQELRADLISQGHTFRTATDTEVIVHLYERYGTACLEKMRGMFAFALWDSRQKKLFAARDRLGKKPFFYTKTAHAFIFGSEIKAITADSAVSVAPNFAAIDQYLTYQYVPSPASAFAGIYKLPPGHFLTCTTHGRMDVQCYWKPPEPPKTSVGEPESQEELLRLLRESVRLRMISDVPLGAFLSGGVDSATVVALMAEESSRPVKTFSIGFEEEFYNELPFARQVAKRYGTEHQEFVVKPKATEILPILVRHYNEPFADSSALPTYYLSKLTREYVTVALSGDGGDENFAGYARYGEVMRWGAADGIPSAVRRGVCSALRAALEWPGYSNSRARLSRACQMLGGDLPERYLLEMTMLKPQEKRACYTPRFRSLVNDTGASDRVQPPAWTHGMDPSDWMMRHDQRFYLPDCLMVKTDIAAMANSLEVRCPLLDHKFMEFTASLPSALKRNGEKGKIIFKNAVSHLLPESIIHKRKMGFGIPLAKWFANELSPLLRGVLLDDRATRRGLFEPAFMRKMVLEQVRGKRDWSNRLWSFLFLELWFREFIDP